jgi:hypothetical protein
MLKGGANNNINTADNSGLPQLNVKLVLYLE